MMDQGNSSMTNPHSNLFKIKNQYSITIQERRMQFLTEQKEKRHSIIDKNRQHFDHFINILDDGVADDGTDEMEWDHLENKRKELKFELMETDWFIDIPDDLEENWVFKCGPAGFRVLLVSNKKFMACYQRGRVVFKRFKSHDPDEKTLASLNGNTVLDCIYNQQTKTVFVIDCLYWNNMSMIDSEADFRFFWLKSKFSEFELSDWKNIKFVLMDCVPAQKPLIQNCMFDNLCINNHKYFYDGIVFYHKKSHYCFGKTPLVGWLASYMLTEILQIDVPQEHLFNMPQNYKNVLDYIQNMKSKKKRAKKKNILSNAMIMDGT